MFEVQQEQLCNDLGVFEEAFEEKVFKGSSAGGLQVRIYTHKDSEQLYYFVLMVDLDNNYACIVDLGEVEQMNVEGLQV